MVRLGSSQSITDRQFLRAKKNQKLLQNEIFLQILLHLNSIFFNVPMTKQLLLLSKLNRAGSSKDSSKNMLLLKNHNFFPIIAKLCHNEIPFCDKVLQ